MQNSSTLHSVRVRAGLAILIALLLPGCHRHPTAHNPGIRPSDAYFKTPFHNEGEFIVQSVTADIAEMAWYAKFHSLPQPDGGLVSATELAPISVSTPKYRITTRYPNGTVTYDLTVNGAIWSPEVYQGFTKALSDKLGLAASKATSANAADTRLINVLLDLTATNLAREDRALSDSLSRDFSNPALHEKAAVLLGAFALRENSGEFFEIRSPLCRMTAHLAIARALAGGATADPNAKLAEVLLDTLMNKEKDALEKIAQLGAGKPELEAWSRALYARNTHDFRPLSAVKNRSLLETIEYFRACCLSCDSMTAWEKISSEQRDDVPDFCRIVNSGHFSVEMGHVVGELDLPLELREAAEVFQLARGVPLTRLGMITALNEAPDRCLVKRALKPVEIHVIGWGQWAGFLQRHICNAVAQNWDFDQRMWGVPREAHDFAEKSDELFHGLRLYPFVNNLISRDEESRKAAVDAATLVTQTTPQWVPSVAWLELYFRDPNAPRVVYIPSNCYFNWYSKTVPVGTGYDAHSRFDENHMKLSDRTPEMTAWFEQLQTLAPYDIDIADALLWTKFNMHPTYEQAEPVYRPMLGYDSIALRQLGRKLTGKPDAYEAIMLKAAAIEPGNYFKLGEYFLERKDDDKAAKYLQKGMDHVSDSVWASNEADWLVKYYLAHGQTAKAAELADTAAETGSNNGLLAKANFLEAIGKYQEALDFHKQIEERYEDSSDLVAFCVRYKAKTGRTDFDETLARRGRLVFTKGIEKVTLRDFTAPPVDGALVSQLNSETAKAGLHFNAVIVALNGTRIHSFGQYAYVRELSTTPQMELIVWQGGKYQLIQASPPNHRFGIEMPTYAAK